jgi:hypothetical protein
MYSEYQIGGNVVNSGAEAGKLKSNATWMSAETYK